MAKKFWAYLGGAAFTLAAAAAGYTLLKAHRSSLCGREQADDEPVITIDPDEEADFFEDVGEGVEDAVQETAGEIAEEFEDIGEKAEDAAEEVIEKAEEFGDTVKQVFVNMTEEAADETEDFFRKIKQDADGTLNGLGE